MAKDYYAILQVPRNASQEDIERAYQRLSALYDPATSQKSKAAQRHSDVEEAYRALGDRGSRKEYDRSLRAHGTAGELTPAEALSNRFVLLGAGVIIVSIIAILVAVLLLAGGGDDDVTPSGTPVPTAPPVTPVPTPTGPTPSPAPSTPPEVTGETITTDTGLQYIDIREGTGRQPTGADEVQVWYTGWLQSDGTKFDSAVDRGTPAVFRVGGVVPGFAEGLLGMKEGGVRRLIIPAELGYGEAGSGSSIPPNSTLIFDVELLLVIPAAAPAATPTPVATPTATATPVSSADETASPAP